MNLIKNCPFDKTISFDSSLGSVNIKIDKEPIYEESPYAIKCEIDGNKLPNIKFGISKGTAYIYIYAIQENNFDRNFKRKTYKVNNHSFIDDFINPENLSGVAPTAFIALTLLLGLFNNLGIKNIIVPSILPVRWNAKKIANNKRINNKIKNIAFHFNNINITSFPFDYDECIHITQNDNIISNNKLLYELYSSSYSYNLDKKIGFRPIYFYLLSFESVNPYLRLNISTRPVLDTAPCTPV